MRGNHAYVVTSAVNAMLNLSIVVNKRWGSVIFSITNSSCTQHENMFSYKPGYNKIKQWLLPLTDFVIKSYFVSDPRTSDPDCNFRAVQYEKYGSSRITPTLLCNKAIHYRYIFHCSSLIYSRLICKGEKRLSSTWSPAIGDRWKLCSATVWDRFVVGVESSELAF